MPPKTKPLKGQVAQCALAEINSPNPNRNNPPLAGDRAMVINQGNDIEGADEIETDKQQAKKVKDCIGAGSTE